MVNAMIIEPVLPIPLKNSIDFYQEKEVQITHSVLFKSRKRENSSKKIQIKFLQPLYAFLHVISCTPNWI